MPDVATAFANFRAAYESFVTAAETLRHATEVEVGLAHGNGPVEIPLIQRLVATHYGYTAAALSSPDKKAPLVLARHAAMWICRTLLPDYSLQTIGEAFGRRDHGTVLWACQSIGERITTNARFAAEINLLRARCESALKGSMSQ